MIVNMSLNRTKTYFHKTNFIKRNNVDGKDIVNVLRTANDVINLNQHLFES